jgi:hypothetical protein
MTIEKLVRELEHQRFYGVVELKFECGRMVLSRKTESIKPNESTDYRNNRDNSGEQS